MGIRKWKYTLDVEEEWNKVKKDEIGIKEFIALLIPKLERINKVEDDPSLENIISEFEMLSEMNLVETEEFDYWWNELYDWCDVCKLCWIKTF